MNDTLGREILDELRAIRAALDRGTHQPNDQGAARLLSIISVEVEGRVFSSAELVEHARITPPLREAIVDVVGELNARKVGKFLRRVEGRTLGELRIDRVGADSVGVAWHCVRVLPIETPETPSRDVA